MTHFDTRESTVPIGDSRLYVVEQGPADLARAVFMDTVVPGVPPWQQVLANPYIWHFAFHAIPDLPERLVQGNQRAYFDYFFDALSPGRSGITPDAVTPMRPRTPRTSHCAPASSGTANCPRMPQPTRRRAKRAARRCCTCAGSTSAVNCPTTSTDSSVRG